MQTFLPYPDFRETAKVLDWRRLGNQRNEAKTLIHAITKGNGWSDHPAAKMWEGCQRTLKLYFNAIVRERVDRGYNNSLRLYVVHKPIIVPDWLGDEDFHASHRSNLLRKDPEYYSQFGWSESDNLEYVWPRR